MQHLTLKKHGKMPNQTTISELKYCEAPAIINGWVTPNKPITNARYKVSCLGKYERSGSEYLVCMSGALQQEIPSCGEIEGRFLQTGRVCYARMRR